MKKNQTPVDLDMNAIKSEPLSESETTFEKIVIPDAPVEIPGESLPDETTNPQDVIADINSSGKDTNPLPSDTEMNQLESVSEAECAMLLHAVYGLAAFMLKGQEPPEATIQWRGKQMYLLMVKYNLQIKYMDLMFFGFGIASDITMIYTTRKKPEKTEEFVSGGE